MRRALVALVLLLTTLHARGAEKDWVDKTVMPRKPNLKLIVFVGNQQKQIESEYLGFTVTKEQNGFLYLKHGTIEGWGAKGDWVLLEDAPAHYAARIKADKNDAWAWSARGSAWDELGEYDNAIKDHTEAIRLEPTASDYYNRAMSYRKKKDFKLSLKDFDEAIRLNAHSDYYNERGHVYFDTGEFDNAIKDYTEAIRLDPRASYYRERGNAYREKREYEKAHKDLNEAIRQVPNDSDFLNMRGLIYYDQNQYDDAIKAFSDAMKADPKFIHPVVNRANSYRDKKEYESAMKDYDQTLRLDPKYDYGLRCRGIALERQKEYAKAIKDFDAAIKIDPKNEWNHNVKAWLLATCQSADFRDGDQAVKLASKAAEISEWKDPVILDTLAASYAEAGDFEKAIKYEKQAIASEKATPDDVKEYKERLKLYEQKKPFRDQ